MNKFLMTSLLVVLMAFSASAQVNVTFWLNTSTVPDTVTPNSSMQVRGGTAPLTWGDDTGGVLQHVEGDIWSVSLQFNAGESVEYKYFGSTDPNSSGWEKGDNLVLTVPASDTSLALHYYRKDENPPPPFTETDSLDIHIRVNMQGFEAFSGLSQSVGARGAFPESGWGTNIVLSSETGHADAGNFSYPASNFYSGQIKLDPSEHSVGDTIQYKFVTLEAATPDAGVLSWEDGLSDDKPWIDGGNRIFTVPSKDTTIVWNFFSDIAPIAVNNEDTVTVTFAADMTRAIESRGFSPGDTVFVTAGFFGTANEAVNDTMFNIEGTSIWSSAPVALTTTIGNELAYQYFVTKNGQDQREAYFDFEFVPDDPSQQSQAERRRYLISDSDNAILDNDADDFSKRRQPFFPSTQALAQDVLVTWEVDMRPAIFELFFTTQEGQIDTLKDIQGNRDIFDPADVLASGVWINGPATGTWQQWGATLEADDARKMYDDGTNGDVAAGDSIFTRQILASPDSSAIGTKGQVGQVFKFGIRGGDNEGGFGNNPVANIDDSQGTTTIRWQFGASDPKKYDHWDYSNQVPRPDGLVSVRLGDLVPGKFELAQNFPNPFNPETAIQYSLPQTGDVTLTIFNLRGQKIATLVNENQTTGNYVVSWSGRDDAGRQVASGVYAYKLEAGNFVQTKKMVLLK